jgi:hypothetical protein
MNASGLIGSFPDDTIGNCAAILNFLGAVNDVDELGADGRYGRFLILSVVEDALRVELAERRPWAKGGTP